MPRDQNNVSWFELRGGEQYMPQQSAACQFVQHFGDCAFHPGAFTRRHDHNV